jgi:hypothetical protein
MNDHPTEANIPFDQIPRTLEEILANLDQTGFRLTGKLKRLLLSDEKSRLLRMRGIGDPVYHTSCLFCGIAYEAALGGMLLACTACTPIVDDFFSTVGDWTRESFRALCRAIMESGNTNLPNEDDWRHCRFCGRGTNLWIGTQLAAPDFCDMCAEQLNTWDVQAYLRLLMIAPTA